MSYRPTTRECLDCGRPFFDMEPRETPPTRCRSCEFVYQTQMTRLWVFVRTAAGD